MPEIPSRSEAEPPREDSRFLHRLSRLLLRQRPPDDPVKLATDPLEGKQKDEGASRLGQSWEQLVLAQHFVWRGDGDRGVDRVLKPKPLHLGGGVTSTRGGTSSTDV